ncbi:MAG: peptidase M23 [Candidatus Levybacteria bacterium GW2011_GWB1_35_5]|nr:MAG: peptidase M23 [Candidatus Levybacteria bacterium GW2011_GWB1_35_5]
MDYKTKTDLILPFKGIWTVTNGGRDASLNSHIRTPDKGPQSQLYAYDFRNGHAGDGTKLEYYEVFGKEVLAPGDGEIIQVVSGAYDNKPGERDRNVGIGNAVIIDHKNGEYSLLGHFKYNSITVKVRDLVKAGDVIGLCGNTGNTSEPHIHFGLQDGPRLSNERSIFAQFKKIMVNGEIKENYEPIREDKVSNP